MFGGGCIWQGIRGYGEVNKVESGNKEDRSGHIHQRQVPLECHIFINLLIEEIQPPQHCQVQGCFKF